jgi:glycosyltransferase involved in cell wall biosynthesis|tara:strand:+ start:525 stop:1466 length:942 start_codon:yes stop_codon:yes gene_type:complete
MSIEKCTAVLTIAIPTYNRCDIVESWLKYHCHFLKKYPVKIVIFDNASSDKTQEVVSKYVDKYMNVVLSRSNDNIGGIENVRRSYQGVQTPHVWIIGDSYSFEEADLIEVLSKLNLNTAFILVNLGNINKNGEKVFSANEGAADYSGYLSCVGTIIYNRDIMGEFQQAPFNSYFPHTYFCLKTLSEKKVKGLWLPNVRVKIGVFAKGRKNWANTSDVFEIGLVSWINTLDAIPYLLPKSRSRAYKQFGKVSRLFSFKGLLWLRAQGLLTFQSYRQYLPYFKKTVDWSTITVILACFVPQKICIWIASLLGKDI